MTARRLCAAGLVALITAGCAGTPAGKLAMMRPAVADPGVRVESLRLTAADYMLDMRFRVTNQERAAAFFDRKTEFELVDPVSGARLAVPDTPKLGRLRQVARKDMPDRSYFLLFANPGRFLKTGSHVILMAGDTRISRLTVE